MYYPRLAASKPTCSDCFLSAFASLGFHRLETVHIPPRAKEVETMGRIRAGFLKWNPAKPRSRKCQFILTETITS